MGGMAWHLLHSLAVATAAPATVPPAHAPADAPPQAIDVEARQAVTCVHADGTSTQLRDARDLTWFIGMKDCWDANEDNTRYVNLNDLYVHWTVKRIDPATLIRPRDYRSEDVPPIVRIFFGKNRSFVTGLRIDMHNPDLTFSIPLVSFGYEGKVGKGQVWTTEVVSDDQAQPWFRVDPYSAATITASAKSSQDLESRAAGAVLGAIRSLSALVSPGGPLLTRLNGADFSTAANKVDDAIGKIWSKSISERQISGRALSEWYGKGYLLVQVATPAEIKTSGGRSTPVFRWYKLTMSCPRYSVFSAKQTCPDDSSDPSGKTARGYYNQNFINEVKEVYRQASPEQILDFHLAPNATVLGLLQEKPWYTGFLRLGDGRSQIAAVVKPDKPPVPPEQVPAVAETIRPARPDPAPTVNQYAGFCTAVVSELYQAGLSAFNARLGLWAVVTGSLDFAGLRGHFADSPDCKARLPGGPDGNWQFTYTQGPQQPDGANRPRASKKRQPARARRT